MSETTVNITNLPLIEDVPDTATMPIVTKADDGTYEAGRIEAKTFKGQDAYDVAVSEGYTGSMAAWQSQCAKVGNFNVEFDPDEGTINITI